MMFSLFSNWRQGTLSSSDGDSDDVSSLNRSLNLPWPVTESSSPRKSKNGGTPPVQQPVNGTMNVKEIIGYPMPKVALKSLTTTTRSDDHPVVPSSAPPGKPDTPPSLHPFIPASVPPSGSVPWYQESAAKRKKNNYNLRTALLQANAHAAASANPPPQVVRLDSNSSDADSSTPQIHHDTSTNQHASSYAYDTYPYANGISNPALLHANQYGQTLYDDNANEEDEHEIYASPFGHSDNDDENGFFRGPHPNQTRTTKPTPNSRWGGLKLHTVSPFSQSTLRVDGLDFPPPPDTSSHHSLPLPTVNTDVYNNAYNYPLAKQLSPIAEQDYFSPTSARGLPGSAASASPGADSVLHFGSGNGNGKERTATEGDKESGRDLEKGSIRTRSIRTGSVGSTKAPAMTSASKSGSSSMREGATNPSPNGSSIGSEIIRPSPIYASPFITRHLNRTTSQTSSNKSESPSQAQSQPPQPPPSQPPPPPPEAPVSAPALPITQPEPQPPETTQSDSPSTPTLSRMTSEFSMGSITPTPRLSTATITPANAYLKLSGPVNGSVQTPTSATPTTGTMQTPDSAFPVSTPTSPTSATTGVQIPVPAVTILPCIPPLDLRPFFPGPHPSPKLISDSEVPRLRPPKTRGEGHRLSVIRGSGIQGSAGNVLTEDEDGGEEVDDEEDEGEEEEGGGYDVESLHADSFVTATTNSNEDDDNNGENDEKRNEGDVELAVIPNAKNGSHAFQLPLAALSHSGSGNSTGDSFITRRWDRDAALGLSLSLSPTRFRERKHRFFGTNSSFIGNLTPGFWAFWLGFLFPVLWLVGGWHFTNLGEQPPKSNVWEWYFWRMRDGWWRRVFVEWWWCCGVRRSGKSVERFKTHSRGDSLQTEQGTQKRIPRPKTKGHAGSHSKLRSGKVFPALPRWVAERQSTDDGRMKLNDPKRSLKGISFGYPFISRPPHSSQGSTVSSSALPAPKKVLIWIEKPNRMLDQLYGVKLREVQGRPESGRRMFDPWIQRCRYAFCWTMLVLAIGLCTACAYLIVVNTRRL